MQYAKKVAILLTILPLVLFTACRQETEIRTDDDMAATEQQPDLESFRSDVQAELQRVDQELSQLEQDLAQATEETAADIRDRANDLREERMEIERDLQELSATAETGWEDNRRNLQQRVDELAVDVSRARLDAASTIEEFRNLAQSELNEIDRKMSQLESQHQMATRELPATDADRDVVDGTAPGTGTGVPSDPGITGDPGIATRDVDGGLTNELDNLREERQQISAELDELTTVTEDDFDGRKDQLADAIADLNSDVRTTMLRMNEEYDFAQTDESPTRY